MKRWIIYIMLVIVALLPYLNSFKNPLIWDDLDLIFNDPNVKELKNIPKFFTTYYWQHEFQSRKNAYRPLRAITFTVDYAFWKKDSLGYHLTNVLLNLVAVLLVFKFAEMLSKSTMVGVISALFFATLPVHVETISWVKNRSEILCLIFFISSLIFFYRHSRFNLLLSIFSFILALMSKENAVVLPLVLILLLLYQGLVKFENKEMIIDTKKISRLIPYFGVLSLYLLYNFTNFTSELGVSCSLSVISKDILIIPATISEYIKILLWPFPLCPERFISVPNLFSIEVIISVVFFILTILLLKHELKNNSGYRFSFACAFILITLIPVSNIIYFEGRPIAEQRLYLPSVGLAYFVGLVFSNLNLRSVSVRGVLLVLLIMFNAINTFARNYDWKDPLVFWQKAVRDAPFVGRAYVNLAMTYRERGKFNEATKVLTDLCDSHPDYHYGFFYLGYINQSQGKYREAIDHYKRVLDLAPSYYPVYNNLGIVYDAIGDYKNAVETYKKGIQVSPQASHLWYNLAATYEKMGLFDLAMNCYNQAAQLAKEKGMYYTAIGSFYERKNEFTNAMESYRKALEIEPDNTSANYNLGLLLAKLGRYDEAMKYFTNVYKILPYHIDTINNIGIIYDIKNEREKSLEMFNKAISINSNDPKAYYNRGQVYFKLGDKEIARQDFKKVLELEPENKGAKEMLMKL